MAKTIEQTMGLREWIMLLLLSILWGGSFFFVGVAVKELPPLTIVAARVTIAALTLWTLLYFLGYRPPQSLKVWSAFFVMGLINNVIPFSLIVWGQMHIASGLASILNAITPLFTVIIAGMLLPDEPVTMKKLLGVALGFIGVIVLIGSSSLAGFSDATLAQLAILGAAISYGFAGVYGRRFKTMEVDPKITAAGQVTASSILLIPIALFVERSHQLALPSTGVWVAVIGLAVLSTAVAYILYFEILSSAGATNLSLVTLLIPLSAILLGFFVLNERLRVEHFVGMALISMGLFVIDGRLWNRLRMGA